jgi:hypothetical protein
VEGHILGYSRGENPKQRGGDTWKDKRLPIDFVKQRGDVLFQNFRISETERWRGYKVRALAYRTPNTRNNADRWINKEFTAIDLLKRGISGFQ